MPDEERETLPDAFWRVARALRTLSRETLAPLDIAPSHARALGVLLHAGPMHLRELAERLRIAPRSTTDVVDGLEERGLVERRPDPDDRRAMLVSLTDNGRRIGSTVRSARQAEAERFFGALSQTDRTHLGRILRKLRTTDSGQSMEHAADRGSDPAGEAGRGRGGPGGAR